MEYFHSISMSGKLDHQMWVGENQDLWHLSFPWCKYSHHDHLQATNMTELSELQQTPEYSMIHIVSKENIITLGE